MGAKNDEFLNYLTEFKNIFLIKNKAKNRLIITHLWVDGFGWENTILIEEDFIKIEILSVDGDLILLATQENKTTQILKGYYEKL